MSIPMARAAYQHINPQMRLGKTKEHKPEHVSATCKVFVRDRARPVSTFPLTMRACHNISHVCDMSPFEIHAYLLKGGKMRVMYDGKPAIIRI